METLGEWAASFCEIEPTTLAHCTVGGGGSLRLIECAWLTVAHCVCLFHCGAHCVPFVLLLFGAS